MRYTVRKGAGEAAYLQLYRQIRGDITEGVYSFGARMPSKRNLSGDAGVSVITVEHAYALLCDEGYLEARERSGYYVCYRSEEMLPVADGAHIAAPDKVQRGDAERVPLEPPADGEETADVSFPFSVFARTMRRVLTSRGDQVLTRVPNTGLEELRRAIAAYLARSRGIAVRPETIVVGAGAEYLYGLIVQMLGRNRIYGIEDPSYQKIRQVYEANGATCEMLRLGNDGIRSDALRATNARILHVTPFNSFPSGITATASKRREYLRWAGERDAIILEDDYDSEFSELTKAEDTLFSLEPERAVIYLNTFSRTIASSMRMGYLILPGACAEAYLERISFYACAVPALEQYVLAELLNSGDFERHINRVRRARRQDARAKQTGGDAR